MSDKNETWSRILHSNMPSIHRATTVTMMGFHSESELTSKATIRLNDYENAYLKFCLNKWGEEGPKGSVLRMESVEETITRELWEEAAKELIEVLKKEDEERDVTINAIISLDDDDDDDDDGDFDIDDGDEFYI